MDSSAGAIFAITTIAITAITAIVIILIIAMVKIFNKAGEPGWKSIIPGYGQYVSYEIAWQGRKVIPVFILGGIASTMRFVTNIAEAVDSKGVLIFAGIVAAICGIVTFIFQIIYSVKLAHRFGKSGAFGFFMLVVLPFIGYPMLAFGSADYDRSRDPD